MGGRGPDKPPGSARPMMQKYARALLADKQIYRLTVDLKSLCFAEPLLSRVLSDNDFVESISLSYLTAALFQSSEAVHATEIRKIVVETGDATHPHVEVSLITA